jgi:hypothetical protein
MVSLSRWLDIERRANRVSQTIAALGAANTVLKSCDLLFMYIGHVLRSITMHHDILCCCAVMDYVKVSMNISERCSQ